MEPDVLHSLCEQEGTPSAEWTGSARLLVRVERVYAHGMTPVFSTRFPSELDGLITERQFKDVIDEINHLLADADALDCITCTEGVLDCLTCFVPFAVCRRRHDSLFDQLDEFIERTNQTLALKGLVIRNPVATGMLSVDICTTLPLSPCKSER